MQPNIRLMYLPLVLLLCYTSARAQIVNIEEQRITNTNDSTRWYGYLRGSAALTKVKQQSLQLQGQSKIQFKKDPHLALLLLNINLLRAGNQDFAKRAFAHLRYNYELAKNLNWEAYAQIQTSPIQLLDQRRLLGTGLRWRLLKSANGRQRIYLGAAWLWEHNIFTEPYAQQFWNRSSNYLSTTLRFSKQATLIGTAYWQPVWGRISNYRLSTEWVLQVAITKKLALTIDFSYSRDNNLPPEAPSETYAWRNGITWQL